MALWLDALAYIFIIKPVFIIFLYLLVIQTPKIAPRIYIHPSPTHIMFLELFDEAQFLLV